MAEFPKKQKISKKVSFLMERHQEKSLLMPRNTMRNLEQEQTDSTLIRYLPTYRMEPKKQVNKEAIEKILKEIVIKSFENFRYESKAAQELAKTVSEEIKYNFKIFEFDRFRIISVVTIGEHFYQGYHSMCSFLWDPINDGFVNFTYDTSQYFVVATLYYIYYD